MHKAVHALLLAAACGATAAAETRHVHGSWVNLRGAAATDAPVLARLSANTAVQLLREEGRFCQVETGAGLRGYIACNLLGTAPLRIEEVGEPGHPAHSPLRAFWVAPSVKRLLAAGEHVWMAALTEEQRKAERPEGEAAAALEPGKPGPRLLRPPVPEFDAMKELLKAGVVAHAENIEPRLPWSLLRKGGAELAQRSSRMAMPPDSEEITWIGQLDLPPARPSLFKDHAAIAAPHTSTDGASARFGITERARVLRKPKWGVTWAREFTPIFDGSYDIGSLEVQLDRPVAEHALGRQGLLGAAQTRLKAVITPNGDQGACEEGYGWTPRADGVPVAGRPRVKDPMLLFLTPAPLPATQVRVTTKALTPPAARPDSGRAFSKLVQHQIDLDADGADDLLLLEATGLGQISERPAVLLKLAFVNVAGEWFLLALDRLGECT